MYWFERVRVFFGFVPMSIAVSLKDSAYVRGDMVEGTITLTGGTTKQKALSMLILLKSEKVGEGIVSHGDYKVYDSFVLDPKELKEIPFAIELPIDGPMASNEEKVYLMAHVVKWMSVSNRHKKYIQIIK